MSVGLDQAAAIHNEFIIIEKYLYWGENDHSELSYQHPLLKTSSCYDYNQLYIQSVPQGSMDGGHFAPDCQTLPTQANYMDYSCESCKTGLCNHKDVARSGNGTIWLEIDRDVVLLFL